MKKRLISLLLTLSMVFSMMPILGIGVWAAGSRASKLLNPPISPVLAEGVTYEGKYRGVVDCSSDLIVEWEDVGAEHYYVAVKALSGEPNRGDEEDGTILYKNENCTKNSTSISLEEIQTYSGCWIKVYIQTWYAKNDFFNCHYYFKVNYSPEEEVTSLEAPEITVKTISSSSLKISWDKVSGATGYEIYRSTSKLTSSFKYAGKVESGSITSWTDTGLKANTKYYYKVKAFNNNIFSAFSNRDDATTEEETSGAKFDHEPTLDLSIGGNYLGNNVYGTYIPGEDTIYFRCTADYSDHVYITINNDQLVFWLPSGIYRNYGTFVEKTSESKSEYKTYTNGKEFEIHIPVPEGIKAGDYTISVTATDGVFDPVNNNSISGTSYYDSAKESLTVRIGEKFSTESEVGKRLAQKALSLVGKSKNDLLINGKAMPGNWCAAFVAYCANSAGLCGNNNVFRDISRYGAGTFPTLTHANPACLLNPGKGKAYYYYQKGETYYKKDGTSIKWANTWTSGTCYSGKDVDFFMKDFEPQYLTNRSDYSPVPGDLIFIKKSDWTPWAHVGIIVDYNKSNQTITFVDGNNSGNGTFVDGVRAKKGEAGYTADKWENPPASMASCLYVNKLTYKLTNEAVMAVVHLYDDIEESHTHSYIGSYLEGAHDSQYGGHREYSKCSCGATQYTGNVKKSDTCAECQSTGGYTISGKVTSFLSDTDPIGICVLDSDGTVVYETTVTGTSADYTVNVHPGTYHLTISKKNHATRTYDITVDNQNVTRDTKIYLLGDISGDGKIGVYDLLRIKTTCLGIFKLKDYEFVVGDINGDGKYTTIDYARAKAHCMGTRRLY